MRPIGYDEGEEINDYGMTTPRIEEMVEDLLMDLCEPDTGLIAIGKYDHDVLRDLLSKAYQAGRDEVVGMVVGWREKDWPEKFDRYTAQLIADDLEKRLALQDNK